MENALVVLIALVCFAALSERLRLGTFIGYLLGGVVIGPWALGLVEDMEAIRAFAELGVVFLLFSLGLELKFERLRLLGPRVYSLAAAQIILTAAAGAAIAATAGLGPRESLVIGGGLALSSTAVVLQVLGDMGRTLAQLGRVSIAILLVQDLIVGPMLVMVEVFAVRDMSLAGALGETVLKAVLALAAVVIVGRVAIRPAFALAAQTAPEVFTGFVLLLVLGASWATGEAGLSMALGAFVAGLMVADTEFRMQVAADIAPFRGLLLGLFFMSIGMSMDLGLLTSRSGEVALTVAAIVLGKALVIILLARLFRFRRPLAFQLGWILAQGSEFAFVLFAFAVIRGVIDPEVGQLLVISVAITMIFAPLSARPLRRVLDRIEGPGLSNLRDLDQATAELRDHVLVIGFGQVGMALTRHLVGLHVPVIVLENSSRRVLSSRAAGLPVFYGNAARPDVLQAVHAGQASVIVVGIHDDAVARNIVTLIHDLFPGVPILARVTDPNQVDAIRAAGARAVVLDGLTTALDLAERVLEAYPMPEVTAPAADRSSGTGRGAQGGQTKGISGTANTRTSADSGRPGRQ